MENYQFKTVEVEAEIGFFKPFFYSFLLGLGSYIISVNYRSIVSKIGKYIMYSPGVGKTSLEKIGKKRYAFVETDLDTMKLPVMKMASFEYIYGFFEINDNYPCGVMDLDKFKDLYGGHFPPSEMLKNVGDYLVLNHRRPSDFRGRHNLYGFVRSDIDDLILVYFVENNQLIDYESIEANFVEAIETFQPEESDDLETTTTLLEEPDLLETTAKCTVPTPDEYITESKSTDPEGYCYVGDLCVKKEETIFRFDRDYRIDDESNNCLNSTETFAPIKKPGLKVKEL